jgi:DNA-binding response OmpR family regulator
MNSEKLDVLFIDYDSIIVEQVKSLLTELKVVNFCTDNLNDALSLLDVKCPKVVITGRNLPDLPGENIAIRFSELVMFKDNFIYLLLTQEIEKDEMYALLTLGFNEVFYKTSLKDKITSIVQEKCLRYDGSEAA